VRSIGRISAAPRTARRGFVKESSKLIAADELYRLAGIVPKGTTSWDDDGGVPSKLPGVYVISITEIPTNFKQPLQGARAFVLADGSNDRLHRADPL